MFPLSQKFNTMLNQEQIMAQQGIKKKMLTFSISQSWDKPELPTILPGRRPIIQIAERPILQPPNCLLSLKQYQKFH